MYTSTMRFTGFSGLDIDSMVTKLMKAESMKYDKLQQKTTLLMWRQDGYRAMADKMKTFQSDFLSLTKVNSMRLSETFSQSQTTVTENGAESKDIKVLAATGLPGKYEINVRQLAVKDSFTSDLDYDMIGKNNIDYTKLREGDGFSITLDGRTAAISFSKDDLAAIDSNEKFVEVLNNKLETAFGTNTVTTQLVGDASTGYQLKFDLSKVKGSTLKITEKGRLAGTKATRVPNNLNGPNSKMQVSVKNADGSITTKTVAFARVLGESVDDLVNKINDGIGGQFGADDAPIKAVNDNGKILFVQFDKTQEVTISSPASNPNVMRNLGFDSSSVTLEESSFLADMGFELQAGSTSIDNLATSKTLEELFPNDLVLTDGFVKIQIGGYTGTFLKTQKLQDVINDINKHSGAKISYDLYDKKLTLEAKESGVTNALQIGSNNFLTKNLGFTAATRTMAQSAIVEINGEYYSSPTNVISLDNGKLKFELGTESKGKKLTLEVKRDVEKVYDAIKKFVDGYNTLLSDIYKETSTKRPTKNKQTYEPLTDDQRKEMKENDVKLWEEKAKTGLLYNDPLLNKVVSDMRKVLYQPVDLGDGKKIALYEIGISTASFDMGKEKQGQLVIDEKKLKQAIEERIDDVTQLFTKSSNIPYTKYGEANNNNQKRLQEEGLADRIYDLLEDTAGNKSSIASKAGIKGTISESTSDIYEELQRQATAMSEMLKLLTRKENNYYSMFSRMEAAMVKSDNQMAYLQQQLSAK